MKDLAVSDRLTIPESELDLGFARASGPGGQNVNKVESKVELRWSPGRSRALAALGEADRSWLLARLASRLTGSGELVVTASRSRDQVRNREDARAKLAAILNAAMARPRPRRATRPTRGSTERRIREKKRRGEIKRIRRAPP
jgi:ribosome-associated protein